MDTHLQPTDPKVQRLLDSLREAAHLAIEAQYLANPAPHKLQSVSGDQLQYFIIEFEVENLLIVVVKDLILQTGL